MVRLDRLPLNASSKVDLVALRAFPAAWGPDGGEPVGSGRRPATPAQRAVAAAWSRVFGSPEPSLDDDFFAAGGHSLLAMRLGALLRAEQQREFAVDDVFLGHTVEGLARRLEAAPPVEATAVPTDRLAALSAAQRRLWFLDRLSEDTSAYNIAVAERLRGPLDPAALRAALAMVAERQQILRWRVSERDSRPGVAVAPPGAVELPVVDLTDPAPGRPGSGRPGRGRRGPGRGGAGGAAGGGEPAVRPGPGPLWRARLLRLGRDDHVLALTLHHLIFDGWSLDVLYRDLAACYRAARDGRAVATLPTGLRRLRRLAVRAAGPPRPGRPGLVAVHVGRCQPGVGPSPGPAPAAGADPPGRAAPASGPGGGRRPGPGAGPGPVDHPVHGAAGSASPRCCAASPGRPT